MLHVKHNLQFIHVKLNKIAWTHIYLLTCLHYYFKSYSSLALGLSLDFRWVWWGLVCLVTLVVSDSLWPHGPWPARLLCPRDSPSKNAGVVAISFSSDIVWSQWREVTQSCPTLCDSMDCSLPGSTIHGIFQARVVEWGAITFSRWGLKLLEKDMSTCKNIIHIISISPQILWNPFMENS